MKIIERTALSSNLKIILAPVDGVETVTGIFAVRAGWKYETLKNHGIAHFLEHVVFKGTKKRPTARDIAIEIDSRGGQWNAYTSEETTVYWIKLAYQQMGLICDVIDVISDMVFNSNFKPPEIETEKGIIIQELFEDQDDPDAYMEKIVWPKLLYGDQPAGRCSVGTEESIKAITRGHFVKFLDNLYTDENAVFCLVGKIPDEEEAIAIISDFFREIRKGPPKIIKPPVIENQTDPALFLERRDIKQSNLILGVRAYNFCHPKRHILQLINVILGGNCSSRLYEEIREKRGWAYSISTFLDCQSDTGEFGAWAGINREKTKETIMVIMDEYRKIREEKISEEELQRAKDCITGSSQIMFEDPADIAFYLVKQWAIRGEIEPISEMMEKIKAVTAEDIQSVAQEIFVDKNLNFAVIGPHKGMKEEFLKILKF